MIELIDESIIPVGQLSQSIKKSLEVNFSQVKVLGEISGVTRHSSGHIYFSLKDDLGVLDAISWRGTALSIQPEEGIEVIAIGRLTTYPMRSKYQIIIQNIELSGQGELFKLIEKRKKKFAEEGLFDRKRPLPYIPDVIGIVASPTGAVIRDILVRLRDRMVSQIIFMPAKVQGDGAVEDLCSGIRKLNEEFLLIGAKNPVIIIARGGGSIEDFHAFQEEAVIRAIATSNAIIISALGHETDTTLADFAADVRAPTPTAAAEIIAPLRLDLLNHLGQCFQRISNIIDNKMIFIRHRFLLISKALRSFDLILNKYMQIYDEKMMNVRNAFRFCCEKKLRNISIIRPPKALISYKEKNLQSAAVRIHQIDLIAHRTIKLKFLSDLLESVSYDSVLKRGFAIAESMDLDGKKVRIRSAADARKIDGISIGFYDGNVDFSRS